MYSKELQKRLINLLAPNGYVPRDKSEARYPKRTLVEGAIVTRSAPSPTGFVHIGTIYMSLINKLVALTSNGVNMLRIEDTDKKREIEHGVAEIVQALELFDLRPDEGVDESRHSYGLYGPYMQSERAEMYLGFAIDLMMNDHAYPCFATPEELDKNFKAQQAAKVRPGYYGSWALWRDKSEAEIVAALDANKPFVLRFRSDGSHEKRIQLKDVLKGHLELPENDLDVPLIKSDEHRLPTYHLAHVVDDYLMQTSMILRGDEWLPSTPLHVELAQALGIKPFKYAHFTPISVLDGASKRKLSKRKDPEANVKYFIEAGYPTLAVLEYLVRLSNSNFEDWRHQNPSKSIWDFKFSFEKWAKARGALLDIKKLDDVSKDFIAELSQNEYEAAILDWANRHDKAFYNSLSADSSYTKKVLNIEREGDQKRKDLSKWGDAPEQYGYFFDDLFTQKFASKIEQELGDIAPEQVHSVIEKFFSSYDAIDSQESWLAKLRLDAESLNLKLGDFARILRVKLTGKNRTPDLYAIMQVMGIERLKNRLN